MTFGRFLFIGIIFTNDLSANDFFEFKYIKLNRMMLMNSFNQSSFKNKINQERLLSTQLEYMKQNKVAVITELLSNKILSYMNEDKYNFISEVKIRDNYLYSGKILKNNHQFRSFDQKQLFGLSSFHKDNIQSSVYILPCLVIKDEDEFLYKNIKKSQVYLPDNSTKMIILKDFILKKANES